MGFSIGDLQSACPTGQSDPFPYIEHPARLVVKRSQKLTIMTPVDLAISPKTGLRRRNLLQSPVPRQASSLQQAPTPCKKPQCSAVYPRSPPESSSHPANHPVPAQYDGIFVLPCRSSGLLRRRNGTCLRSRLVNYKELNVSIAFNSLRFVVRATKHTSDSRSIPHHTLRSSDRM